MSSGPDPASLDPVGTPDGPDPASLDPVGTPDGPDPASLDPVRMANRRALGKRPNFLDDPAVERVLSITMAVATELAVARERIDTLERLLVQKGVLGAEDIEHFQPDTTAQEARNAWGREYIARVLRILEQDVQAMDSGAGAPMDQLMEELGQASAPPPATTPTHNTEFP